MSKESWMKRLLIASLLLAAGQADAAEADPVHFRILLDRNHIDLHADGTYTSDYETAYTLLTAAAVQSGSQVAMGYNPDFGITDVKSAWVEHADGTRTDVDLATAVHDRSQATAINAPMLTQDRVKVLVFPDVKMGDTLHYVRHSEQSHTLYPGQFNIDVEQRLDQLSTDAELIIDAPASVKLHVEDIGFLGGTATLPDGKVRHSWTISNNIRKPYEQDSLALVLTSPHIIVTTFGSYGDLAAAYRQGAEEKSVVTPAIQALADQVAGNTTDPHETALRLSDWVSRNIRYVAIYFGSGGVVPVPADDVLKNRYGDCKGHAILLEALLKARKIPSSQALIDYAGALYRLPATTLANGFDHVITYVPSLDLWLDSTANNLPLGTVPEAEAGKPALLVATGEVKSVPIDGGQKIASWLDAKLAVQPSGDLDMNVHFILHGPESTGARQYFRNIQPQDRRDFVRDVLAADNLAGNGEVVSTGKPDELDHDFEYAYRATLFGYAAVPGPFGLGLPTLSSLQGPAPIVRTAEDYVSNTKHRESEMVCYNVDRHEHFSLQLPANVKLLSIPSNMDLAEGAFHYTATYKLHDKTLDVERTLTVNRGSRICAADVYEHYRPFFQRVMSNLRSQVLYQPAAGGRRVTAALQSAEVKQM
jgi:hypothetical protein